MRLLLVLLLAGCAATPWVRPGGGNQDYFRDDDLCAAQSRPSPKGTVDKGTYDACMLAKGWVRR